MIKKFFFSLSIILVLSLKVFPASGSQLQLETIGATSASTLYLSYMAIGVVADSYQSKVYNKDTAKGFVREAIAVIGVCKNYMNQLIEKGEMSPNDIKTAKLIVETYDFLINEGQNFINYVDTNDSKYVQLFHDFRKKAWNNISNILGLNKKGQ
ncbi:MAG TPA: hypothetical protein PKW55_02625 [Spirochaetota bacterium]|nr:hypothetical protein [Spirochaetota bacterium]HOM38256.1 hypothetical protein [Spirochaetota bacterium]HPQ48526.1 hypothetical protein [Spirochaetota bacterium]